MTGRATFARLFREAAERIDPSSGPAPSPDPALTKAWLTVHSVRGQTRWLDAALDAAGRTSATTDEPAAWMEAACLGWVQRASRVFRGLAADLEDRVPDAPASVPALLLLWRTTGLRRLLDRALGLVPEAIPAGDVDGAAAAWAAYLATAQESFRVAALEAFPHDLAGVAPAHWPALVAARQLSGDDAEAAADSLVDAPAPQRLVAAACLAAPVLDLRVEWFVARELLEGPMAEAATYPWPALRLSFVEMPGGRDQLRMVPILDGDEMEPIMDVGVVVAGMELALEAADRTALLEGSGRRRGRSLLRGR